MIFYSPYIGAEMLRSYKWMGWVWDWDGGWEEEEGANEQGPLARSEDAAGASALVVDADAVEDSRRLRERARVCRQLMEELYRVAKVEYDEDGNYDKLKEIEETYYSTITSSI